MKHLVFCRLLLSYAGLLPAVIRADSVKESSDDIEFKDAELRDVCLKMESRRPQEVRSTRADLFQNEGEFKD